MVATLLAGEKASAPRTELAAEFGVTQRTIYRDLAALEKMGFNVRRPKSEEDARSKGYRLPPLLIDEAQATVLLMGTRFIALHSDARLAEAAEKAARQIQSVLSKDQLKLADTLSAKAILDPYWLHQTPTHEYWTKLMNAIKDKRVVWLQYFVHSRNEVTERKVNPLGLVFYVDHWNLIAFDQLRDDLRQFNLSYIQDMDVMQVRFDWPEDFDLETYLRDRGENRTADRIRVRFEKSTFQEARTTIPARLMEETADGEHVTVEFRFGNLPYLAHYLVRFGTRAEVLEPVELQQRVRDVALKTAAQYGDASA